MPLQRVSPVVDGMLNAYGLAARIQGMAQQKAEFEGRQQDRKNAQDEREFQRGRELKSDARADETMQQNRNRVATEGKDRERRIAGEDLTTRMRLQEDPNLVPLEAGQTTRPVATGGGTSLRDMMMGVPQTIDAPIDPGAVVGWNGQNYAIRSQGERDTRARDQATLAERIKNPLVMMPGFAQPVPKDLADNYMTFLRGESDRTSREGIAAADRTSREGVAKTREAGANTRSANQVAATKENSKRSSEGNVLQQKKYRNEIEQEERKLMTAISKPNVTEEQATSLKAQLTAVRQKKVEEGMSKPQDMVPSAANPYRKNGLK